MAGISCAGNGETDRDRTMNRRYRLPILTVVVLLTIVIVTWLQPKMESLRSAPSQEYSCREVLQCSENLSPQGGFPPKMQHCAATLSSLIVRTKKADRWGYSFNYEGCFTKPITEPQFEIAEKFGNNGLANLRKSGKWGYINMKGDPVVTLYFDEIGDFDYGIVPAKASGKWRFFNTDGNAAFDTAFDEVSGKWGNRLTAVRIGEKWGYIDPEGVNIIVPAYDAAMPFQDGLAKVRAGAKWGVIDIHGKTILPMIFDVIFNVVPEGRAKPDLLMVSTGGRFGYFDVKGESAGKKEAVEIIPVRLREAVKIRRDNNGAILVYLAGAKSTLSEDIGTGAKANMSGGLYLDSRNQKLRFDEKGKAQLWNKGEWFYVTQRDRLIK